MIGISCPWIKDYTLPQAKNGISDYIALYGQKCKIKGQRQKLGNKEKILALHKKSKYNRNNKYTTATSIISIRINGLF